MCLAEQMNSGLHPRVNCYTGLADQLLPEHTHVCLRIRQFKVAPMDQGLQGFGRPRAAEDTHTLWAHIHVSCRIVKFTVSPKG